MVLNSENTNIGGYDQFFFMPRYIYIEQSSGTTTEIVIMGIKANDLGAFGD